MRSFLYTISKLYNGQSLTRLRMNTAFESFTLKGKTLDIGGGRNPDYFSHFAKDDSFELIALDASLTGIDFERDVLPVPSAAFDTLICANLLEHIYNYQFLLKEMRRVLKSNGQLIGFVPFWMAYHPDPRDYFRYTREALERMLTDAGFAHITIKSLPGGPFAANFNTIALSLPRALRPIIYLWYALCDVVFITLRPEGAKRYPLGFIFTAF